MINIKILKKYCSEDISLIENFNAAINSDEIYECHHKLEVQDNGTLQTRKYLIDNNLYYDRPANELILLTKSEHTRLHSRNRTQETLKKISDARKNKPGHKWSEESRKKLSNSVSGEGNGFFGKKHTEESIAKMREKRKEYICSEETKKKITESNIKRFSNIEERQKISRALKGQKTGDKNPNFGKHWYTNGITNICSDICPEGFYKGRILSEETKKKISETLKTKSQS